MTQPLLPRRHAGLLLHPTSLPSPFGIGDFGPTAFAWVDALAHARQTWWQILPLGPTGSGDSPYQCFSAFAGNPSLVSPQWLLEDGLLDAKDLDAPAFPLDRVDYCAAVQFKNRVLAQAWENFQAGRCGVLRPLFDHFCADEAGWLDDYALFMAIKDSQGGRAWYEWPTPLRMREQAALKMAKSELARTLGLHQFRQFLFFRQWQNVKDYAHKRAIKLIGDVPIFVSADSADVWANPQLFALDRERRPKFVAGVPPDYFSATGQLWGNPHYDWDAMAKANFAWWIARFQAGFKTVDLMRLDHFRGFEAYWEVPAGSPNAIGGRWVKAPGEALLNSLREALGGLPIIAEDLGLITPEVDALRRGFDLPGMRVLHFAFAEDAKNPFLPHNYETNTVVYTGTHDNDTTWGWYRGCSDHERDHVRRYLGRDGTDISWDFIRLAWSSIATDAIAPLQDVLNLGTEARMNYPGRPNGNWAWRFQKHQLTVAMLDRLADLTQLYRRV